MVPPSLVTTTTTITSLKELFQILGIMKTITQLMLSSGVRLRLPLASRR
jgi:hypothetical protein